jgi:hypothetical protein
VDSIEVQIVETVETFKVVSLLPNLPVVQLVNSRFPCAMSFSVRQVDEKRGVQAAQKELRTEARKIGERRRTSVVTLK